jgi:hypothetical protein
MKKINPPRITAKTPNNTSIKTKQPGPSKFVSGFICVNTVEPKKNPKPMAIKPYINILNPMVIPSLSPW